MIYRHRVRKFLAQSEIRPAGSCTANAGAEEVLFERVPLTRKFRIRSISASFLFASRWIRISTWIRSFDSSQFRLDRIADVFDRLMAHTHPAFLAMIEIDDEQQYDGERDRKNRHFR